MQTFGKVLLGAVGLGLVVAYATRETIKAGDEAIVSIAKLPAGSPELATLAPLVPPGANLVVQVAAVDKASITGVASALTMSDGTNATTRLAVPPQIVGLRSFPRSAVTATLRDGKKVA